MRDFKIFINHFLNKNNSQNKKYNIQKSSYINKQNLMIPSIEDQALSNISQNFQQKHPAQNLTKATKKLSTMNVLIIQKLSIIVSGYFESVAKLQKYYQQIQTLVSYNKRVIEILEQFQQQEEKLIKRLRRMQEINLEYMRQYCQVKGKQFKMPNTPEHKSIFSSINLQEVSQKLIETLPPVIDINYKNELMNILKTFYLNKQDRLFEKVSEQLNKSSSEVEIQQLTDIKQLLEQYNSQVEQLRDEKPFELLKLRSQIRNKVENFYDKGNNREIKPQYQEQQKFINKIINLHVKIEQMNEQALLFYLEQQKKARSSIEQSRIEIQQSINKICEDLTIKNREKEVQIELCHQKYIQQEKYINQYKKCAQEKTNELIKSLQDHEQQKLKHIQKIKTLHQNEKLYIDLVKKLESQLKLYKEKIEQLLKKTPKQPTISNPHIMSIQSKKNFISSNFHSITIQKSSQNQIIRKLQQHIKDIEIQQQQVKKNKQIQISDLVQKLEKLEIQYKQEQIIKQQQINSLKDKLQSQLQIEFVKKQSLHHEYKTNIQDIQGQLEKQVDVNRELKEQVDTLCERMKQQKNQYQNKILILREEINKMSADRLIVENLAVKVNQVLQLVAVIEVNQQIKDKLNDLNANLKKFIGQYEKNMEWNIMNQSPAYFRDYSMLKNNGQKESDGDGDYQEQIFKKGYSLDMKNIPEIKVAIEKYPKDRQNKQHKSFIMERIMQYSIIHKQQESLNLSKQVMEEIENNDEYENMRRLYQQAIQCLEMEQKKSKMMSLEYQRFTQAILNKQKQDPQKYSLEKQLVYLKRLTMQQKQTIQTQRKEYNEIFRQFHQGSKLKMQQQLKSLRSVSFQGKNQNKPFV